MMFILIGSSALDSILGGGVETSSITEFWGEFRTGKTQVNISFIMIKLYSKYSLFYEKIAHTITVTSQLSKELNGGQGKAIYLDTEGNFRSERVEAIAERFGLDPDDTLENIIICRVFSHEEQMESVKAIASLLADVDQGPFRLLIVDSIISLFRVEFPGRGELSERQQKLGKLVC